MMGLTFLRPGSEKAFDLHTEPENRKRGRRNICPPLANNPFGKQDVKDYWEIALTGHTDTQLPHSMQVPSSTFALPSIMLIASTGQFPTQVSQPTHALESTFAFAIIHTSLLVMFE